MYWLVASHDNTVFVCYYTPLQSQKLVTGSRLEASTFFPTDQLKKFRMQAKLACQISKAVFSNQTESIQCRPVLS